MIIHVDHCVSLRDLRKVLTCRIVQHVERLRGVYCENLSDSSDPSLIDIVTACDKFPSFSVTMF